jgi:hypothetical protein
MYPGATCIAPHLPRAAAAGPAACRRRLLPPAANPLAKCSKHTPACLLQIIDEELFPGMPGDIPTQTERQLVRMSGWAGQLVSLACLSLPGCSLATSPAVAGSERLLCCPLTPAAAAALSPRCCRYGGTS